MAKNICAVSMVKNESDIIESFCRYTLTFCNGLIIFDDSSIDGTREILYKLINEGLNITLLDNAKSSGHYQSEVVTLLANMAINEFGADLIVPLDADEFLTLYVDSAKKSTRDILEGFTDTDVKCVPLVHFLPDESIRSNGVFLPSYFKKCFFPEYAFFKIIVGAKQIKEKNGVIELGSHSIIYKDGERVYGEMSGELMGNLILLHYPIRSVEQATAKAVVNWSNTICVPGRSYENKPHHWRNMYNEIKKNGMLSFDKLVEFSKIYCNTTDAEILKRDIPIVEYSSCSDIVLRYTDYGNSQKNYMNLILSNYEHIIDVFMANMPAGR